VHLGETESKSERESERVFHAEEEALRIAGTV
jgi:hypothetical protein